MNQTTSVINKVLSLSPLIGLIPVYVLWACETYYVFSTFADKGYCVNYRDPKVYSAYILVEVCMNVFVTLLIPSFIATIIGIIRTIRDDLKWKPVRLFFYLIPIMLYIVIVLNFSTHSCDSIFGAFYWFGD